MKLRRWSIFLFIFILLGCSQAPDFMDLPGQGRTASPGGPVPLATNMPDVKAAARAYLDGWKGEDYPSMYALLSSVSKDARSLEEFTAHYQGVAAEAALSGIDYEILSSLITNSGGAQVNYRVTLHSALVGDLTRDTVMDLHLEQGQWRVEWNDTLILPELSGGNYLGMERQVPARANIYDRGGRALVAQINATAIGLYPDEILPEQEEELFSWLTELSGLQESTIRERYASFPPGAMWYLPIAEVPVEVVEKNYQALSNLSGLEMHPYKSRYYFEHGIAPHVVGYVGQIQAEQVNEYLRKGYRQDELVGQAGIELWAEPYLAGKRGGSLYVFNSQGKPVTILAETKPEPARAVYTTLERDFQKAVQEAINGFRAAAVVLERDTGRVLALASSPAFDPNAFVPTNYNSYSMIAELFSDPAQPLYNRAAQGQYPLGSVFKIVTMAAALESGLYQPGTTYYCGYTFEELPGATLYDWTHQYGAPPSGMLTLSGGLIRSCNPYFWHIGLDLYERGLTQAVSDLARSFGFGERSGIVGIEEETGNVPDPQSLVDATNLAIGQGDFMTTPLQVAVFAAAVGNGGVLYQPQLIEKIAPPGGEAVYEFQPEVRREIELDEGHLEAIQEAMVGVIRSTNPGGTAWHRFTGLDINVAGKTGTAQTGTGMPHAWFAGYTFDEREDRPDIAIAVIVERIGEGSDYAAPVFRRIVEAYFGQYPKLYPWESQVGVPATPEPGAAGTPAPEGSEGE